VEPGVEGSKSSWPFDQPTSGAAITLRSIVFGGSPVLFVSHDEDDHGWQFLGRGVPDASDAAVVSMREMADRDPTLLEIADLPPGWVAHRSTTGGTWYREMHSNRKGK
jgi:hypothetical protein